ncbi:MAG: WD40 repeat domain-containing serine/threonine protein kinase, partial [Planctomycetota bacterium]
MTDKQPHRARELFDALAPLTLEARAERLQAEDSAVRAAVETLLRDHDAANEGGFMSHPTGSMSPIAPVLEGPGSRVGPYKILQRIGEGGFGTVFLAEQAKPVRRKIALKIIKLGMDTRQVVARFEAERQALALMDHPHIARVLDAGATDSGRPYFAMEYVVGDAITTFADAHKLSIPDRLSLFAQVCSAVQHAHTKGVIHRDLKPANVLVSMVDGRPFARVIDFGIAKATGGALTDKTLFTEHRQLIGTPEYMSPEQAEGSPDLDTRTDVYALGVLLYELLTGETPFEGQRLRSAAYAEMQRILKEEEPPIPSLRLSRDLEHLAARAAAREAEPERLSALVRGELDWVVMKALDKDRARRYESPAQFAADVHRHLEGEAVEAAPPSAAYRLRKVIRRHKGPVIAGTTVAAVLLAGIAGTTASLLVAQHNADVALHNAKLATAAKEDLERVNASLTEQTDVAVRAIYDTADRLFCQCIDPDAPIKLTADPGEAPNPMQVWISASRDLARKKYPAASDDFIDVVALAEFTRMVATDAIDQRDEAEMAAYTANLALAQAAMEAGDWPEARRLIEACPESKRGWAWRLLRNKSDSIVQEIRAADTKLNDDASLVLARNENEALVYNVGSSAAPIRLDIEHPLVPNGPAAFSDDNQRVAITHWEPYWSLRLYGMDGKAETPSSSEGIQPPLFYSPTISADGQRLFIPDSQESTAIRSPLGPGAKVYSSTGELIATLEGNKHEITGGYFDPTKNKIIITTHDGVLLWDLATRKVERRAEGVRIWRESKLSPDGRFLLAKLIERDTNRVSHLALIDLEENTVTLLNSQGDAENSTTNAWNARFFQFASSGNKVIVGFDNYMILQFDLRGNRLGEAMNCKSPIRGLHVSPTDESILAWTIDAAHRWDNNGHLIVSYVLPSSWIQSAAIDQDGNGILVSDYYGIYRFDEKGNAIQRAFKPFELESIYNGIGHLRSLPTGGVISTKLNEDSAQGTTRHVWPPQLRASQYLIPREKHASLYADSIAPYNDLAHSSTGDAPKSMPSSIAAVFPDADFWTALSNGSRMFVHTAGVIRVWEPKSAHVVASFRLPSEAVSLALSPDETQMVTMLRDGSAMVLDTRSPEEQSAET